MDKIQRHKVAYAIQGTFSGIGGSAMTPFECKLCGNEDIWVNTAIPGICQSCAGEIADTLEKKKMLKDPATDVDANYVTALENMVIFLAGEYEACKKAYAFKPETAMQFPMIQGTSTNVYLAWLSELDKQTNVSKQVVPLPDLFETLCERRGLLHGGRRDPSKRPQEDKTQE